MFFDKQSHLVNNLTSDITEAISMKKVHVRTRLCFTLCTPLKYVTRQVIFTIHVFFILLFLEKLIQR